MKYHHCMTVRMYDTDAAGILYFGNQFRFAHDAFETIMAKSGFSFQQFFDHEPFLFVIVHAESDYLASLHVGDDIIVTTWVDHIGTTSFQVVYDIAKGPDIVGRVKTVHVCIDKQTRKKRPIPDSVLTFLTHFSESPVPD